MKAKVAVIGANGQVAAEVSLLLARRGRVEVVPVCRARIGSAFLRSRGIACRHGSIADPSQARALVGDCGVILNFALALGRPREAREANRALVLGAARAAAPGARIAYFSTMSVYGDPGPDGLPRSTWYGREKLRCEADVRRAPGGSGAWVLRLGHVAGEMQGITRELRAIVRERIVRLPELGGLASNVVHVSTIADACEVLASQAPPPPGIYDLMNAPSWSWREVFEEESKRLAAPIEIVDAPSRRPSGSAWRRAVRAPLAALASSRVARDRLLDVLAWLPPRSGERAQARLHLGRAAAEIAALAPTRSHDATDWSARGGNAMPGLPPTRESIVRDGYDRSAPLGSPFPEDLPPAS